MHIFLTDQSFPENDACRGFAMALQCEGEGTRPCLLCRSCKQAVDHNQPDIIYVSHEKPNTIGVDDIRTQINNDIVINHTVAATKCILWMRRKNEPAGTECIAENNRGTAGICCHPASDHKCGQFSANDFIALHYTESQSGKEDVIKSYLMKTYHIPDYQADVCAAFPREM